MKIKIINISPTFLHKTEKKFKLIEDMLQNKINRIQNKIDTYHEELDLMNQFINVYGNDKDLIKYINELNNEIIKHEHYKKNSYKTMKKIKRKRKKFDLINFVCK